MWWGGVGVEFRQRLWHLMLFFAAQGPARALGPGVEGGAGVPRS